MFNNTHVLFFSNAGIEFSDSTKQNTSISLAVPRHSSMFC